MGRRTYPPTQYYAIEFLNVRRASYVNWCRPRWVHQLNWVWQGVPGTTTYESVRRITSFDWRGGNPPKLFESWLVDELVELLGNRFRAVPFNYRTEKVNDK